MSKKPHRAPSASVSSDLSETEAAPSAEFHEDTAEPVAEEIPEAPPAPEPPLIKKMYLDVVSVSEFGFWRFGQKFTKKPTRLALAALSDAQLRTLDELATMRILKVTLVEA